MEFVRNDETFIDLKKHSEEEEQEYFGDLGEMFDHELPKSRSKYAFGNGTISCVVYSIVEENPGALQSGQYLWPGSPALCEYLIETLLPYKSSDGSSLHTSPKKLHGCEEPHPEQNHESCDAPQSLPCANDKSPPSAENGGYIATENSPLSLMSAGNSNSIQPEMRGDSSVSEGDGASFALGKSSGSSLQAGKNVLLLPQAGVRVLEVGAGCGMVGLVVAQLPQMTEVVLTDRDRGALNLVDQAICDPHQADKLAPCRTAVLEWGQNDIDLQVDPSGEGFHLILGSDVIYAASVVELLLSTVSKLLHRCQKSYFVMSSSFAYGEETEDQIDHVCKEMNLVRTIVRCNLGDGGCRIQIFQRSQLMH